MTSALLALLLAATPAAPAPVRVRFGQFNVWELSRVKVDQVDAAGRGANPQLRKAAEILQRVRPDVLLVNEIDFDGGETARLFHDRYLAVGQGGQEPLAYPHVFTTPVNTGVPSGRDLDHDGTTTSPGDALGYGSYPGQYGLAVYSRHPLDAAGARTFRKLLWRDVPGHVMPDGREGRPAWYSAEDAAVLPLSSKTHLDLPVRIGGAVVHLVAAHPTPGAFDGPEDRNGRRLFDEVRMIADYLSGGAAAAYIVDDAGRRGALPAGAAFVVMGDMNSDPARDAAPYGRTTLGALLGHPEVQDPWAVLERDGKAPAPEGRMTSKWGRIDWILPSRGLAVRGAGVFWPPAGDPQRALVDPPDPASDHRMNWVDLEAFPAQ